jgi:glycine oxidase
VAGAGVLGLSIAVVLAEAGAVVTVSDPAPGQSASAVAAGMLAPAFEAVLDPVSAGHFELLKAARDLWPDFAGRVGIEIDRSGAIYTGEQPAQMAAALAAIGARREIRAGGVFTDEDWRLEAPAALERLWAVASGLGVAFAYEPVTAAEPGVDTVAATGWRAANWAPESAVISAIKGQIIRSDDGPFEGPVERRDSGYIAPSEGGALVGATMQPGLTDLEIDEAASELLDRVLPGPMMDRGFMGRFAAGIRGATPDGLPLVGPSAAPGVWLAMGARRNGWLLAPLVAHMTLRYLAGEDPGPWAPAMNARRFTAPT